MDRFLKVCGVLFLVCIGGGLLVLLMGQIYATQLTRKGQVYVEETLPRILNRWDVDVLFQEAAPEFLQVAPREQVEAWWDAAQTHLGQVTRYGTPQGAARLLYMVGQGMQALGDYQTQVDCERGPATVGLRIRPMPLTQVATISGSYGHGTPLGNGHRLYVLESMA